MLTRLITLAALGAMACAPADRGDPAAEEQSTVPAETLEKPIVAVETNLGTIVMELWPDKAPETVDNFLLHVRSGFYDGLIFHRVKPDFMIQTGERTPDGSTRTSPTFPVANEADNGLKNVRGAVAMARTGDAHSAKSQFFVNLVDNPDLDFKDKTSVGWGYAVFGEVIEGMDVVDQIGAISIICRWGKMDVPVEAIIVDRAYIK